MRLTLGLCIAILFLYQCKSKKEVVKDPVIDVVFQGDSTVVSDTTQPVVISIKEYYKRKCGTCHNLYEPKTFNAEEWRVNLNKMKSRAMISQQDVEDLLAYLTGVGLEE